MKKNAILTIAVIIELTGIFFIASGSNRTTGLVLLIAGLVILIIGVFMKKE